MLEIHRQIRGKFAKNPLAGDANGFLQRIVIEVVADNYRQMIAEAVTQKPADGATTSPHRDELRLDPPIRANERGISGIFASAIGRVSSRYFAEARVDRPSQVEAEEDEEDGSKARAGRVDFLAWYEHRIFGIELKAGAMNAQSSKPSKLLEDKWRIAVEQAQGVQNFLRARSKEDKTDFPMPVSIALLVVIGRRKMNRDRVKQIDQHIEAMRNEFVVGLRKIGDEHKRRPQFVASYMFPDKFRVFHPRRKGLVDLSAGDTVIYTPFVAFLARSYVNMKGQQPQE